MSSWLRRCAVFMVLGVGVGLRRLPRWLSDALGWGLGWCWYRLVPIRRAQVRANLALALPGLPAPEEVVRDTYLHLGKSVVELLRYARGPLPEIRVEGRAHLTEALTAGRGALLLTAHLGNFELLVRGATTLGPVAIVTKTFRSSVAEAVWRALRRGGPELLVARGSARAVLSRLAAGGLVAFVLDQHDPSPSALWLPFFGHQAATTPDLARLSLISGAPIVPVFGWRDGHVHRVVIGPAIKTSLDARPEQLEVVTALCLAAVEAAITAHPEQWMWLHRRWKPRNR